MAIIGTRDEVVRPTKNAMPDFFFDTALLPTGWAEAVRLTVAADGLIAAVTAGASPEGTDRFAGPVLPGLINLHSHAHQRALAGLAERADPGTDSFWAWRQTMYAFLERLTPDDVETIATQLYVEMLEAGYTSVAEFHYLHNQPDGQPYDDPAEMAVRLAAAADRAGIGLTLLPVLYTQAGFDGTAVAGPQRRFRLDVDGCAVVLDRLATPITGSEAGQHALGLAPHSLRAAAPKAVTELVSLRDQVLPGAPIHIHVAEQMKEVDDCLAWCRRRPVDLLFDTQSVDATWCLIHATHMTMEETARVTASGAVVGLCPSTEANLGDGIFPAERFLRQGGRFGIGSDSHVSVGPVEELRWLEYAQRLTTHRRAVLADRSRGSTGRCLIDWALAGGTRASGRPIGALAVGHRADFVVLDGQAPALAGRTGDTLLDSWVFSGNARAIDTVVVGGRSVVEGGRHRAASPVADAYRRCVAHLLG